MGWLQRRKNKFGDAEDSRANLLKLKTDALLSDEGILVRRAFVTSLERIARRIEDGNMEHVKGLLVMGGDIRNLKQVNEPAYGGNYQLGDSIIVNAGKGIIDHVRFGAGDKVARVGGDEFIALLMIEESEKERKPGWLKDVINGKVAGMKGSVKNGLEKLKINNPTLKENNRGELNLGWTYLDRASFLQTLRSSGEGDMVARLQNLVQSQISADKQS